MQESTSTQASTTDVKRVMVATDLSPTADRAVRWAAHLAASHDAELLLVKVLAPPSSEGEGAAERAARQQLEEYAREVAGQHGRALVRIHNDPATAIVEAVVEEEADVLVVGNIGMSGRKQFLLGNIPNRISHSAGCTVVIVNTAGPTASRIPTASNGRKTLEPDEAALLGRAWRIARVVAKTAAQQQQSRGEADGDSVRQTARRFRDLLDELGPTFAKMGQILSTRPDLLPAPFIEELSTLQERVKPLTEAEVVEAMERELGVPWEDVFASIDPTPLAAGTIAQVHRATLESGDRVVVKVQRPRAEADILQDLGLLEMFARRAATREAFRQTLDLPTMIEDLSSSLRRELDFTLEANNLLCMHEVLTPFSRLEVPAVYTEYSTRRLLVMQEVQGVPVSRTPPGPARDEAARQLLEAYYHQVLTEGFFHADPHPGNMKWWNDKIYFLDLGMVGEVDAEVRRLILLLLLSFAQKDAAFLTEIVLLLSGDTQNTAVNYEGLQADLSGLIDRFRDLSIQELQLGPMLQEIAHIAVRNHVRVPAALTLTGKAFAQMQLAAAELNPTLDPFAVAQSYVLRNTVRQLTRTLDPQGLFYEVQKTGTRLSRLLEGMEGVVGARPGGQMRVDMGGTERMEEAIRRAGFRVSLALGLGAALLAATVFASQSRPGPSSR